MKALFNSLIVFVPALIILILMSKKFYKESCYFFTRTGAIADVIDVKREKDYPPDRFTIRYKNEYIHQFVNCYIYLKPHPAKQLADNNVSKVNIYYSKEDPCYVYLVDYNSPMFPVLFFELVIMGLMLIAIWAAVDHWYKKLRNNKAK